MTHICNTNDGVSCGVDTIDLSVLTPTYLANLPVNDNLTLDTDETGYYVQIHPENGKVAVWTPFLPQDESVTYNMEWIESPRAYQHGDGQWYIKIFEDWYQWDPATLIIGSGVTEDTFVQDLANVAFSGGDGTTVDPYQIDFCIQLQAMDLDLTAHYELNRDISCSGTIGWNGGNGFTPIAVLDGNFRSISNYNELGFQGSFEGAGLSIYNVSIVDQGGWNANVFGSLGDAGELRNVHFKNFYASGACCGAGIVGANYGLIQDISSGGLVQNFAYGHSAGIASFNYGQINRVSSSMTILGFRSAGGIVDQNYGIISESIYSGEASGYWQVGGVVGGNHGTVENSYFSGRVFTSGWISGGLLGSNNVGGVLVNSYASGLVTGNGRQGGVVAVDNGGTYQNNFWNIDSTQQVSTYGLGTGLTTSQMQQQSSYTGWDFGTVWSIDGSTNDGYPFLQWEN